MPMGFRKNRVQAECKQGSINFEIGNLVVRFADVCTFYVPFLYAVRYNYIKLQFCVLWILMESMDTLSGID